MTTEEIEAFTCTRCGETKPVNTETGGTGYAHYEGKKVCYLCAAHLDREYMAAKGRICLYFVNNRDKTLTFKSEVTNWPGTLRFPVACQRTGRHNIAGKRYDVWFYDKGQQWHGVTYGDNTQICHCKRVKA